MIKVENIDTWGFELDEWIEFVEILGELPYLKAIMEGA